MNRPEHAVEIKLTEALSAAVELGNEVNGLRAAMREIASEVSAVGCEGADDAICVETNRAKEDWCPYCRIGTIVRDATSPSQALCKHGNGPTCPKCASQPTGNE